MPRHLQSPHRKQPMGKANKSLVESRTTIDSWLCFCTANTEFVTKPTQHVPERCYGWVGLFSTAVVVWGWCVPEVVVCCKRCCCWSCLLLFSLIMTPEDPDGTHTCPV